MTATRRSFLLLGATALLAAPAVRASELNRGHGVMNILGYDLVLTCGACPEQYDVMHEGELVGYARLRHGWFYVATSAASGYPVYETDEVQGDGVFEPDEREPFLTKGITALDMFYKQVAELPS